MITLKEWMEVANYRITEGSDYYAYGGAYALSSWSGDQDGYSLEIVFDQKTQEVYEVQACDYKHNRAYRLINERHKEESRDDELVPPVFPRLMKSKTVRGRRLSPVAHRGRGRPRRTQAGAAARPAAQPPSSPETAKVCSQRDSCLWSVVG